MLLCLEAGLRVCGYGYPTSFFLKTTVNGQAMLQPNEKFGWRFFGPALARTPRPGMFPAAKPANTRRVFVFGESAAFGDPNPDFGLPRVLEALLCARFPGTNIEVINVAMTGINSHVLLPIARDCARYDGDAWVVYMGNNEVVGPFGSGTIFGPQAPALPLVRASLALKATRTGELVESLLRKARPGHAQPGEWGMSLFLNQQVSQGEPRLETAYAHFAKNLEAILRTGASHGVRLVLSTVMSNLKDCPPFASRHRPGLSTAQLQQWQRSFESGCDAQSASRFAQALNSFHQAAQIDPEFAELQYRWGLCCMSLDQDGEAKLHFLKARDADTLRFRADSRLNEIIRSTAARFANDGVFLADSEALLSQQSAHGIPGEEFLYEHVHLNFEGNYRLARVLAAQVAQSWASPTSGSTETAVPWLTSEQCSQRLACTDEARYKTLKLVWLRFNEPPFVGLFDHEQRCRRLQTQMEGLLPALRSVALRQEAAEYANAVALSPGDWVLQKNRGELLAALGDPTGAESCYRQLKSLLPLDALPRLELGLLLLQEGKAEEARAEFDAGLRLKPDSTALLNGQALALQRLNQTQAALDSYQRALELNPRSVETHLNLGTTLESLGRKQEAQEHYRRALEQTSNNPETLMRAGRAALAQGWASEAATNFSRAAQLNPTDSAVHFYLGGALDLLRRTDESQKELAEAVRLAPDHARARVALGVELRKQGRDPAALEEFAQAARLQPSLVDARLNLGIELARLNKRDEARRELEEALRLEPANQTAFQWLSRVQKE